ncbi:MAG TPA: hypothetical protein VIG24_07760 [Acidimicrobiia bacterium]
MAQNDPFNFQAFMAKATMPDDETKRELLREGVSEQMDVVMGEVAPRLWAIMQREMAKDKSNNFHLNAVLNSGIFAMLSWVAACTPRGETNGKDNDEMLIEKVTANLRQALEHRSEENSQQLAFIAANAGQLKLAEDACKDLGKVLTANSMIIKGVHQEIQNMRKGGA